MTAADHIRAKTLVVIPALNEEQTIREVVDQLSRAGLRHVRVVDNGSSDRTAALATRAGAEVLHEPCRGYGAACWTGARNLPERIEWLLFCDADGSDDLTALQPFFVAAAEGCDFVLGSRRSLAEGRRTLTWPQRFGNALAGHLIWLRWGVRFRDLGPLRLIRRTRLTELQMEDRGFGWTVEMQAKAAALKVRTQEIPVAYHPRQGGKSKISGTLSGTIRAGSVILCTLLKLWLRRIPNA